MSADRRGTALATGAASGIGEATASPLAARGYALAVADIDARGESVAASIVGRGTPSIFGELDVAREDDATRAIDDTVAGSGSLDVLVNSAGVILPKAFEVTSVEKWDRVQAVNLRSLFLMTNAAAPHLARSAAGSVVNAASIHAHATVDGLAAHAATKGGVVGMTRSVALELATTGVRVNAVARGIIETPMWTEWLATAEDADATGRAVLDLQPLDRIGQPREVAAAVGFLCSSDASYVTGTTLYVDSEMTARLSHL